MVARVMISGQWRQVTLAHAILNHPGHRDQKSHGRKGGRGGYGDEAALRAAAGSPLVSSRSLSGGRTASVKVEEHEDGTVVRKEFSSVLADSVRSPKDQADAERLGSLVAGTMGVEAPAVVRVGDEAVIMTHIPGQTWAEQSPYTSPPATMIESDQGRMLGMFDVLTGNPDRNSGNVMTDDDGRIVAIDHGLAFSHRMEAGVIGSPFAASFANASGSDWADSIDYSPSDMATIRTGITGLRGEFEAAGRLDWYDGMIERLDLLEPRATGTTSRL